MYSFPRDQNQSALLEGEPLNPFRLDLDLRALALETSPAESEQAQAEAPASGSQGVTRWSEELLNARLDRFAVSTARGDDPRTAAAYAMLLWYAGDREGAQRVAEEIRTEHRADKFAQLALDIRDALAAGENSDTIAASLPDAK
jgi:hypothetical protein